MRFTISVLGKELLAMDFGHDEGLRQLAGVMGEMLTDIKDFNAVATKEPEPEVEEENASTTGPINHHVDVDMERDVEPFDPTMGWRWDFDERGRPDRGAPDAKTRPFGFQGGGRNAR